MVSINKDVSDENVMDCTNNVVSMLGTPQLAIVIVLELEVAVN